MMVCLDTITEEYVKYMGYGTVEGSAPGVRILLKYEADKNGQMAPKIIAIIEACTFNIRNAADAKAKTMQLIQNNPGIPNPADNRILTIVVGHNGQGHHFMGQNIVFCNWTKNKIRMASVSQEMWNEFVAVRDLKRFAYASNRFHQASYPELQSHGCIPLYVLVALTVFAYWMTAFANEKFGYSAQTVLENGQSYRLFTYMFAHGGIRHLLGNMAALLVIGKMIMGKEGAFRFSVIYFCGGILSALADCAICEYAGVGTSTITVGASGAIFALMGAMVTESFMDHGLEQIRKRLLFNVFIVYVLSSLGANTNTRVHFFGLVAGFVLTLFIYLGENISGEQNYQISKREWIDERRRQRGYQPVEKNWYCGPSH